MNLTSLFSLVALLHSSPRTSWEKPETEAYQVPSVASSSTIWINCATRDCSASTRKYSIFKLFPWPFCGHDISISSWLVSICLPIVVPQALSQFSSYLLVAGKHNKHLKRIVGFTIQLIHCINSSELNLQCGDYTHQRGRHNYFIFLFQKREGSLSKLIHNIFVDRMPAEYSTRGSLPDESRNTRQGHGGIGIWDRVLAEKETCSCNMIWIWEQA